MNPLFLCYDTSRFPQAIDLAKSHPGAIIIFNPLDGPFGPKHHLDEWNEVITKCSQAGAKSFGYINLLHSDNKTKPTTLLETEILLWSNLHVDRIFLDNARPTHAFRLTNLLRRHKSFTFLANPGTFSPALRKIPHLLLVEQEDNTEFVKILSSISIFFVRPERLSQIRTRATASCKYAAFEPFSTYHKPSIEYQQPLPSDYLKF